MTPIASLDGLLYTVAAAILVWLGRIVGKWFDQNTAERRSKADRAARAESKARRLTESLHEHRNLMLRNGGWTRETLPPFIRKEDE